MSSSTYREVRTCPHCGRKTLAVEQNDFSGYCDSSSKCSHCDYQIYADADCGPWEQASYKANRKDGVIVAGFFSEDSGEFFIETAPGSLIGARPICQTAVAGSARFSAQRGKPGGSDRRAPPGG